MHDVNGTPLKVGDKVMIEAIIKDLQPCENYGNVSVETTLRRRPDGDKETIGAINTAVMVKVRDSVFVDVADIGERPTEVETTALARAEQAEADRDQALADAAEKQQMIDAANETIASISRWSCFHCGEDFDDEDSAAKHFGQVGDRAACVERISLSDLKLIDRHRDNMRAIIEFHQNIEQLECDLNAEHQVNKTITSERDKAISDAAAMRRALELCATELSYLVPQLNAWGRAAMPGGSVCRARDSAKDALKSDHPGSALLARHASQIKTLTDKIEEQERTIESLLNGQTIVNLESKITTPQSELARHGPGLAACEWVWK